MPGLFTAIGTDEAIVSATSSSGSRYAMVEPSWTAGRSICQRSIRVRRVSRPGLAISSQSRSGSALPEVKARATARSGCGSQPDKPAPPASGVQVASTPERS